MLFTFGSFSKVLLDLTAKNTEKNPSTNFQITTIYCGAWDYSYFESVLTKHTLSFSVGPFNSVSFMSETRNIRSVLLNTFGRSGKVNPSTVRWLNWTFSIWLPQWACWAVLYTFCSPMGSNLTKDYVVASNDTHYHSHITSL